MFLTRKRAYARAGLLGNPSDGYHGKTISFSVRDFCAEVVLYEWDSVDIVLAEGAKLPESIAPGMKIGRAHRKGNGRFLDSLGHSWGRNQLHQPKSIEGCRPEHRQVCGVGGSCSRDESCLSIRR